MALVQDRQQEEMVEDMFLHSMGKRYIFPSFLKIIFSDLRRNWNNIFCIFVVVREHRIGVIDRKCSRR